MSLVRIYIFILLIIGGSRVFSQTVLYNEPFNNALNTCTAVNGVSGSWIWTNSCAFNNVGGHSISGTALFSGSGCQFGNGGATVSGNLITPTIAIGPGGAILNFNYLRVGEVAGFWDVLSAQVSNNNGASYTTILHTNGGGGMIGYTAGTPTINMVWNQACYNLLAYANQTIIVRFNFNSLDGIANNYDGVYVDDITISVPSPVTVWQSTNNVCPGTPVTLTTNAVAGFSWSTGATTPTIVVTPTVTTAYFLNSCSGGAGGSGSLVVNVSPQLSLNISSSSSSSVVCTAANISLTASSSGGIPPYTYTWQGSSAGAVYVANQQFPGTYVYSVSAKDANTCVQTRTTSLTFIQSPTLTSIPGQTICPGTSATLSTSGAHTYTWMPGSVFSHSMAITASVQSTYTVVGTNTVSGCTSTGTTLIQMKPTPTLVVSQASITCAALGFGTVTPVGGLGPFSYLWSPTNQTTAVAANLNTSIYTITVNDAGTGCITTTTTQYTPLTPLTGQLINDTILLCNNIANGSAHFINFANGSGNELYLWTNGTTSFTAAHPVTLDIGSWTVTVSDALTGCQVFSVFTITEPPPLVLNISSNSGSVCLGGQIALSSTISGGTPGYTFLWTGGSTAATVNVLETSPGNYTYALIATDVNSCVVTNSISLNFVPNPTLAVADVSICPLAVGTLSVSGASTYTWNNVVTGNTFTDSPVIDTQYTVVGSALGCTTAASASIVLLPEPVPVLIMPSSICESSTVSLTASGGSSYVWKGPSFFNSTLSNPVISPVTLAHQGTYELTVTAVNGCTASASSSLTVNPTPSLSAAGATVCTSQTLNLTASSIPGAGYSWNGPMNFKSNLQNPSVQNPAVSRTGVYLVIATSVFGCTNTANVNVVVVPPPALTGQLSNHSLCSQAFNGSRNTITLTAGGANFYTIVTQPDMTISNPSGPVTNLTPIPPNTGLGTASLSGSNGVCTVTLTLTFSIIPNPSITVSSTPIICAGENYTYTNQGAASYTWTSATPGFTSYNNGGVAVAHPSITSVFSVFGGSLGCNSPTKTSTITVNPLPTVTVTPAQPTVCLNNTVGLTASGSATAFAWTPAPGLINATGASVVATPPSLQVYTVTGELNNCYASKTTTVVVKSLPEPIIEVDKTIFCENDLITLKGKGGVVYEWYSPNKMYFKKQILSYQAGSGNGLLAGGVYSLTVTDEHGCSNTATQLLTVYDAPHGSLFGYKEHGCLPLCAEYTFVANGSESSSSWTINNQKFGDRFTYCFSEAGTYSITGLINDKNTGCTGAMELHVTVHPKPIGDFSFLPLHPVENIDEVKFTNTSIGQNQKSWNWYFANNNGYQSSEENVNFLFAEPGEYPVALVVSDENYCQDTVVKTVKVEPDFAIYIPNAFTPNGDGLNDLFLPIVRSSYLYSLSVFDRWGKRIFFSTSPQTGWDGTFMGTECKADVYNYQLIVSTVAGEKKEYTGRVSLVR